MKIGISAIHVRPQKSGSHEPYMVNLIHALAGLNTPHKFTVFVTPANQYLFQTASNKMDLVVYPRIVERVLYRIFFEQFRLPLDVKLLDIDVMHYPGTTASIFLRRSDVVTVHHDSMTQRSSMSRLHNFYYDMLLPQNRRAGRVIVPTQAYASQMIEYFGYKPDNLRAVYHGVHSSFRNISTFDVQEARRKYGIEENAILTVVNTRPHKNILNLLKAYNILLTEYGLDNQLVMVGNVDMQVLGEHISRTATDIERMKSRISVIPFLPHDQLPPIYSAALAFVFYSLVETFGMPLVEAMACGLPVIASDIPIHREVLYEGAALVSPHEPQALAKQLHDVITKESYRSSMKVASLERSRHFSWERTSEQTVKVYEEAWQSWIKKK